MRWVSHVSRVCLSRRCLIGLVVVLGALVLPATASAASRVDASGGFLDWTAGGDPAPHTLVISYAGGNYSATDAAGITAGDGCTQVTPTSASCSAMNVNTAVTVDGGGSGDNLTVTSVGPEIDPGLSLHQVGVFGNGGNDTITTPGTADLIRGGDGNDMIDGGPGRDSIGGQRGVDTVTYAARPASEPVVVDMQGDSGEDGVDVENVIGTPGNDTIIGFREGVEITHDSSPANTFAGGGGNDLLSGLSGADILLGQAGNDRLLGGQQKDKLVGGSGRDRCVGGPSKDKAKGCERKRSI
jgi:Ca2+-binding RTX toxin-like protein